MTWLLILFISLAIWLVPSIPYTIYIYYLEPTLTIKELLFGVSEDKIISNESDVDIILLQELRYQPFINIMIMIIWVVCSILDIFPDEQ